MDEPLLGSGKPPPRDAGLRLTCPRNHALLLGTPEVGWTCRFCLAGAHLPTERSWRCDACSYDLCQFCARRGESRVADSGNNVVVVALSPKNVEAAKKQQKQQQPAMLQSNVDREYSSKCGSLSSLHDLSQPARDNTGAQETSYCAAGSSKEPNYGSTQPTPSDNLFEIAENLCANSPDRQKGRVNRSPPLGDIYFQNTRSRVVIVMTFVFAFPACAEHRHQPIHPRATHSN